MDRQQTEIKKWDEVREAMGFRDRKTSYGKAIDWDHLTVVDSYGAGAAQMIWARCAKSGYEVERPAEWFTKAEAR